jgi:tetratricopeptide (TPR) repeat protein
MVVRVEANPQADAHFKKGLQLSLQKKWPQAEAEYRKAIAINPKNAAYRSYLADALAAQGKFDQAQSSYQQSDKIKKSNPPPTYKTPARRQPSVRKPSKATGSTPRVATMPRTPTTKAPRGGTPRTPTSGSTSGSTSTGTTTNTARIPGFPLPPGDEDGDGKQNGTSTRVITRDGQTIIITTPGDGGIELDGETQSAGADGEEQNPDYQRGLDFVDEGQWAQAEAAFRAASKVHPKSAKVWRALGDTQFKQNKWKDAEKSHREAIRLEPEEGWYHAQLAADLLKQGHRDEASKEALASIRLGVEDHEVFDELGLHMNAEHTPR